MSLLKKMTKEQRMSFVKSLLNVERTFLNLRKTEMEENEIAKAELYIELLEKEVERLEEIAKITQQLANLYNINVVEHVQNVLLAIKKYFEEQYLLENNGEVDD